MKAVFDHIERAKQKPHHVRRRIAFGTAFGITGFVALVWVAGTLSSGVLAIQGASFADSSSQGAKLTTTAPAPKSGLVGAASAAFGSEKDTAHIEIVSTATSSTLSDKDRQAEQTVIPF